MTITKVIGMNAQKESIFDRGSWIAARRFELEILAGWRR